MRLDRMARWALWPLIIFATYMALSPNPMAMPTDHMGDKVNHMIAFAVLTLISRVAYPTTSPWRVLERMALFGALIEVFQAIPELHRDCDWRDWVADMVATLVVLVLHGLATRRFRIFNRA